MLQVNDAREASSTLEGLKIVEVWGTTGDQLEEMIWQLTDARSKVYCSAMQINRSRRRARELTGALTLCWQQPIYEDGMMRPSFRGATLKSGQASRSLAMVQPARSRL